MYLQVKRFKIISKNLDAYYNKIYDIEIIIFPASIFK